jgi:hypothetical protein
MKTFWLYNGTKLVGAVRHKDDATPTQVIYKALNEFNKAPTVSHLWPDHSPGIIRGMICRATIED